MKKYLLIASILLLAAACHKTTVTINPLPAAPVFDSRLEIDSPKDGDTVAQTFTITGKAQDWFEGNISLAIYDDANNQLYKTSFVVPDNYGHPAEFNQSITLTRTPATLTGYMEFTDYSAKDGSVTYQKKVNIKFESSSGSGPQTYKSPDTSGFSISYPSDFGFSTNVAQIQGLSYIPTCEVTTLACVFYTGNHYQGTNFEGAGVSVTIDNTLAKQPKCYNFKVPTGEAQTAAADVTINGLVFKSATGGQGAAGHSVKIQVYRNYHNSTCYQIAQRVASTNIDNYPAGSIKQFNQDEVWQKLQTVVNTFTFTR